MTLDRATTNLFSERSAPTNPNGSALYLAQLVVVHRVAATAPSGCQQAASESRRIPITAVTYHERLEVPDPLLGGYPLNKKISIVPLVCCAS
jgi:hypothetical protein